MNTTPEDTGYFKCHTQFGLLEQYVYISSLVIIFFHLINKLLYNLLQLTSTTSFFVLRSRKTRFY
jgi:hypothetical protein